MTPELKVKFKTIRIEYWDCGDPDHEHTSQNTASTCMHRRLYREGKTGKGMSTRLKNCLLSARLSTIEEIRLALADGRLDATDGFGRVCKNELLAWLKDNE